jgi:hypothetical protein
MAPVGAEFARIRDFKASLETVLDDFKARGSIYGYSVGRGKGGLVVIDKVRPPTRVRAAQRLQLSDDSTGPS